MTTSWIKAALAGTGLLAGLAPGLAVAHAVRGGQVYGSDGYGDRGYREPAPVGGYGTRHGRTAQGYGDVPREGLQPDGCVKQCDFDMNPCDPPSFKHADGRCAYDR